MDLLFEKHRDAYISYRASLTYPLHWHKEVEIAYLFTGESHMIVSGKHYTLHEGDCAFARVRVYPPLFCIDRDFPSDSAA